jgi:hypothetical protein
MIKAKVKHCFGSPIYKEFRNKEDLRNYANLWSEKRDLEDYQRKILENPRSKIDDLLYVMNMERVYSDKKR